MTVLVASTLLLSLCPSQASAQGDPAAGVQMFSTNNFGVDLATGSINVAIPLRSKPTLSVDLVGSFHAYVDDNTGWWAVNIGLQPRARGLLGYEMAGPRASRPYPPGCHGQGDTIDYAFYVQDATGAQHPLPINFQMDELGCIPPPASGSTTDGSGLTVVTNGSFNWGSWLVYDSSGTHTTSAGLITPDGVTITSGGPPYGDALSSTAVLSGTVNTGSAPDTYSYYDASGTQRTITANKTGYYQSTAFTCGLNHTGTTLQYFPTSIVGPTGTYSIAYEQTPGKSSSYVTGRIASLTYPSGAVLTYSYIGTCPTGSVQVTVNDGNGNNSQYTYSNSGPQGVYGDISVIKTDPAGNQTVYIFAGEFQTLAATYQGGCPTSTSGCNGGGTLLRTITTCYNGVFGGCGTSSYGPNGPALPITQTD